LAVLVAVMVIAPVDADGDALTVSVLVATVDELAVTEAGLNEQERPVERPVVPAHERLTLPEKLFSELTLMVSVVEPPGVTVSLPFVEAIWKSGRFPLTITVTGTRWEIDPLVAVTLTAPVSEYPPVVLTVSVELTAVLPLVVTGEGGVQVVAVKGATGVQVNVMFDPLVPSTLRARVPELPVVRVMFWAAGLGKEGVTEKSETPVMALSRTSTSSDPKPVTRS